MEHDLELATNLITRVNVGAALTRTAGRSPDQLAVVDGARRWTFAELNAWVNRVAREYVAAYLTVIEPAGLLPPTQAARRTMIELFVLEKAIHEVENELLHRPEWVEVPLRGVLRIVDRPGVPVEL